MLNEKKKIKAVSGVEGGNEALAECARNEILSKLGFQMPFGELLRMLRQQPFRSLSHEEIAEKLGIGFYEYVAFENGAEVPGDRELQILSKLYGVPDFILKDYSTAWENRQRWMQPKLHQCICRNPIHNDKVNRKEIPNEAKH